MEIYLIRHTRVGIETGICYGHTDVPLAESFAEECEILRSKLPAFETCSLYSSPSSRCRRLAEQLYEGNILDDPRLMELNFGDWEMQRWDDIEAGALRVWTEDIVNQRCPQGESYREQFQRVAAFWEDMPRNGPETLLMTHSGVIRAVLAHLLSIPLEKSLHINIEYGSVTKIHLCENVPMIEYINR